MNFIKYLLVIAAVINSCIFIYSQDNSDEKYIIEKFLPVPTKQQLDWQKAELIMFLHFGINTFTDKEWGDGSENPEIFNPENLDAEQWIKTAKESGFQYVILTAKHHDGFCLWPSKYTEHSVKNSPYKNGKGDVVKEFSDACHKQGIKFAFYLSPWDRHEKTYGTEEYNDYFCNQLEELLTNYGKVSEVWFDGACGEGKNGKKQVYDWQKYYKTVKKYQNDALIAITGPDIRWIGNEDGLGSETEWCAQNPVPGVHNSAEGEKVWYPSECDVSIRPGWFYHQNQDTMIKSTNSLVDIYFRSVGRNSNLLLNVPPDKNGLISVYDTERLNDWKNKLDGIFKNDLFNDAEIISSNYRNQHKNFHPEKCLDNLTETFWITDTDILSAEITIKLPENRLINIIRLEEPLQYGQRVAEFEVFIETDSGNNKVFAGTTIGKTRLITFDKQLTKNIKIVINRSLAPPAISRISGYYSDSIVK